MQTDFTADTGTEPGAQPTLMQKIAEIGRSFQAFLLVGIAATIVHYAVLQTVLKSGVTESLAYGNMLGFCSGLIISYTGNRFLVFDGKRSHLSGLLWLLAGYFVVMLIHTGLIVGLAEGGLFRFLSGPAATFGGALLLSIWDGVLTLLPSGLVKSLTGETTRELSTTAAFLVATGTAAVLTYCWNRFVVFQPKAAKTAQQ